MLVNLAHTLPASRANGPGLRAVIWVQGCGMHCVGCHNPSLWRHVVRRVHPVDELARWVLRQSGRGLTLSGGEPFEQSLALLELARIVREAGKDVVAFSGFTREQLDGGIRPFSRELLAEVDLLIDGPYEASMPAREGLRGSSNQRLHFLTGRISSAEIVDLPRLEVTLGEEKACVTGFSVDALSAMGRN